MEYITNTLVDDLHHALVEDFKNILVDVKTNRLTFFGRIVLFLFSFALFIFLLKSIINIFKNST